MVRSLAAGDVDHRASCRRRGQLHPGGPALLLAALLGACGGGAGDSAPDGSSAPGERRVVILFIGDGMGPRHTEAARRHRHGPDGPLFLQTLPHGGQVVTASLSGTTDSAAAATTMASGVATVNGAIGVDDRSRTVETLIERAGALGLATGVVTTSSLSHATPGAFTAHRASRIEEVDIAADQALATRPDVLLGGGSVYYRPAGVGSVRHDDGLIAPLLASGHELVESAAELAAAEAPSGRLLGLFAPEHMTYVLDRSLDTAEPTLADMAVRAAEILDRDAEGFFLLVEGARIDMASHAGDLDRAIAETLAFDEAVEAVASWAADRPEVTILVTADHECGGLELTGDAAEAVAGETPAHTWRWGRHSGTRIEIRGAGPGAALLDGETLTHTGLYLLARTLIDGEPPALGATPGMLPDGRTSDLRHLAAEQSVASGFGAGFNQLDALRLDADRRGLAIAIDGLFERDENAVVVLVDIDPGAGTGPAGLRGALDDTTGRADAILTALPLDAPGIEGFGADFAVVVWGAADPPREELWADAGLRGLRPPFGQPDDLGWYGVAVGLADEARAGETPAAAAAGRGLELHIPWPTLYPELAGLVPAGAAVAVAAILVNDDGTFVSNQALPPFPAGSDNPGSEPVALPGIVEWVVDGDGDGVPDGDPEPAVRIP